MAASAEKERKHFCLVADLERRMNTLFFATSAQVRSGEHSTTDLTIVSCCVFERSDRSVRLRLLKRERRRGWTTGFIADFSRATRWSSSLAHAAS